MTWIQLDCDWGLPCVNIQLSRRCLRLLEGVPLLRDRQEDAASCAQLEAWLAHYCSRPYAGMQLVAVHLNVSTDTFVLTVSHPQFPRTPPGSRLPEWAVIVHAQDPVHPYCTREEWRP